MRSHSESTKYKMRIARLKNPIKYWLGKKRPDISKMRTGKKHSLETIEKIKKRVFSREAIEKMSIAKKGKKVPSNSGERCHLWRGGISTYKRKLWLNNKRRVLKMGNGGSHTLGEWENLKAQYNWTCPCCKKLEPEITLSRDHIIPLSKGGSDNIENIQPLCRSCNSKKYNKIFKF